MPQPQQCQILEIQVFEKNATSEARFSSHRMQEGSVWHPKAPLVMLTFITWWRWCLPRFSIVKLVLFPLHSLFHHHWLVNLLPLLMGTLSRWVWQIYWGIFAQQEVVSAVFICLHTYHWLIWKCMPFFLFFKLNIQFPVLVMLRDFYILGLFHVPVLSLSLFFFFFLGSACGMQKFPGQGLNPCHSSNSAGSLTSRLQGISSCASFWNVLPLYLWTNLEIHVCIEFVINNIFSSGGYFGTRIGILWPKIFFFLGFYLFYHSWFTLFCQFLLYSKVTQSLYICVYIYIHTHTHTYNMYIVFLTLSSIMFHHKWLDGVPY